VPLARSRGVADAGQDACRPPRPELSGRSLESIETALRDGRFRPQDFAEGRAGGPAQDSEASSAVAPRSSRTASAAR
jgi:hypothetical protein